MSNLTYPPADKMLLGYLVLNATKTPEFPFVNREHTEVRQHIDGAINGSVVNVASEVHDFYYPQRSRNYVFNSVQNYSEFSVVQPLMSDFANLHAKTEVVSSFHEVLSENVVDQVQDNSLVVVEQHRPFGMNAIFSRGVELYMYGLHNEHQSLLVWTNLSNYEDLLVRNYGDKFWLYRFRPRRDVNFVVFSRRVCSRWFRWGQQENFKNPAARFPALERQIFSRANPHQEQI